QLGIDHPIAIRYPRGRGIQPEWKKEFSVIEIGKAKLLKEGNKIAVLSTGFIGNNVTSALRCIHESEAIAHYHFGFVKPLDEETLHHIFKNFQKIITLENGTIKGGFGSAILELDRKSTRLNSSHVKIS